MIKTKIYKNTKKQGFVLFLKNKLLEKSNERGRGGSNCPHLHPPSLLRVKKANYNFCFRLILILKEKSPNVVNFPLSNEKLCSIFSNKTGEKFNLAKSFWNMRVRFQRPSKILSNLVRRFKIQRLECSFLSHKERLFLQTTQI